MDESAVPSISLLLSSAETSQPLPMSRVLWCQSSQTHNRRILTCMNHRINQFSVGHRNIQSVQTNSWYLQWKLQPNQQNGYYSQSTRPEQRSIQWYHHQPDTTFPSAI